MRGQAKVMVGLAMAGMVAVSCPAKADPKDYRFEAVQSQVPASEDAAVAIRMVHLPDGKPVLNAIVFQPKMEMPMANMAPMATKVSAVVPDGKGAYTLTADLSMAGPWTLSVSAKVQGETATIVGTVPFTATGSSHGGSDHKH